MNGLLIVRTLLVFEFMQSPLVVKHSFVKDVSLESSVLFLKSVLAGLNRRAQCELQQCN